MKVKVISNTIQEFNGERFYLCGNYFQHQGKRLHRIVWEYNNGAIPEGYDVHHKDKDRTNNQIWNLEMLPESEHCRLHGTDPDRLESQQKHIEDIRPLAAAWHGSEEGRAWHSEHGKQCWENAPEFEYVCTQCGKTFTSKVHYSPNRNKFCSNNCRSEFRRDSGVDDEERVCIECGRVFVINRYAKARCCSRSCAVKHRWSESNAS